MKRLIPALAVFTIFLMGCAQGDPFTVYTNCPEGGVGQAIQGTEIELCDDECYIIVEANGMKNYSWTFTPDDGSTTQSRRNMPASHESVRINIPDMLDEPGKLLLISKDEYWREQNRITLTLKDR